VPACIASVGSAPVASTIGAAKGPAQAVAPAMA